MTSTDRRSRNPETHVNPYAGTGSAGLIDSSGGVVDPLELSPASFARFSKYITGQLGIRMPEAKIQMLKSRLLRRIRHLQLASLDDYYDYLFQSPGSEEEKVHFINAVTTNKTDFFREPQHFDYLVRVALPALASQVTAGRPWHFTLWCAGCSSGEEPFTQAMVLSEYARQRGNFDFAILATDVSTKVLTQAQTGIYDEARIDPVPPEMRRRYLLRSKDADAKLVRVIPELRKKVGFQQLNFMAENYAVKNMFDVIFFRNVMIYFDKPTQEAVINKLCRNLKPKGYLFVGHSESLAGLDIPVAQCGPSIFRKPD